jgi:hypothetical protein
VTDPLSSRLGTFGRAMTVIDWLLDADPAIDGR